MLSSRGSHTSSLLNLSAFVFVLKYEDTINNNEHVPCNEVLFLVGHLELVESCIQQSKRLMVILTPASGPELQDQDPDGPQYSDMRGFDWQARLWIGLNRNLLLFRNHFFECKKTLCLTNTLFFVVQIVLHHALVQNEMGVILIQIGETGPGGFTHLPAGLQHLILKSPPMKWRQDSWGAASRHSRFWKKVRYLMPAVPTTKC